MAKILLTPKEAKSLVWYLDQMAPAQAAHDCSVTLASLGGYTDRRTEKLRDVLQRLDRLERKNPERAQEWRAAFKRLAEE